MKEIERYLVLYYHSGSAALLCNVGIFDAVDRTAAVTRARKIWNISLDPTLDDLFEAKRLDWLEDNWSAYG